MAGLEVFAQAGTRRMIAAHSMRSTIWWLRRRADAPGGYAGPVGRQLSPVAGRRWSPVHPSDRGDDATGSVVNALFCEQEDTNSYFRLMQGLLRRGGISLAPYTDRHPVVKHRSEYQPAGTPTQFGRAMAELGTQLIFALSPHAKGRVERTAGTFQDRLITELRLAGATTMEQAKAVLQQFLPRFNRRFGVPARCPDTAFRTPSPELYLEQVLCFKRRRRVARDNTIKFQRPTLQLLPGQQRRSYAGASLVVPEGLDGRLSVQHDGRIIAA